VQTDTAPAREDQKVPVTKIRTLRVDDELWKSTQDVAADQGEAVADFLRRALRAYIADPNATNAALATIRGAGK
jgi:negative regulator of replication initiation